MRDYREKTVAGFMGKNFGRAIVPQYKNVTIRMTSDALGQTLSLQAGDTMIGIPLEQVTDIIKVVKKG